MTKTIKLAFIKARWHAEIVYQAAIGFAAHLQGAGCKADIETFDVPDAFEMPLLAKKLAARGDYDGIVCAALVVDGGIYRHDFVAQAVVNGLMQAQMETGVPVLSVSLTPHHFQSTPEHIEFYRDHFLKKGREAADAILMISALDA